MKRVVGSTETWQIYGLGGELVAEYKSAAPTFLPTKEYGYRGGQLLVTMSSGDDARLTRFVQNLYYGVKKRDPDATELQNGINTLAAAGAQGQSQLLSAATSLARTLFTNSSYQSGKTDAEFVTDVYYAYTQRGPDTAGLNFWTSPGEISQGRAHICDAFEASIEFQTLVSTLYGTATSDNQRTDQIVRNFYVAATGVEPTSTQIQTERDALNAAATQGETQVQTELESFGRGLFAAQVNDSNITTQEFVTNLYEGFLQRGPDSDGLTFWSSGSKSWSLDGMATSIAFRELAATLYRESFWLVTDHLGTPRMIVDKSGTATGVKRHDYLPFGEEMPATFRTGISGYATTDTVRQKFTGYEFDTESALNFAQARYQSTTQGRFTSVDPLGASASVTDPQSFNRYSYVQNNPMNFTDPTGMMLSDIGVSQTNDPEKADTLQRKSDNDFRRAINGDYGTRHGGSIRYNDDGSAHFVDPVLQTILDMQEAVLRAGEVAFFGYQENNQIFWWWGGAYTLPWFSGGTSVDPPIPTLDDYKSADLSVQVGVYSFGLSGKLDRFGGCYLGLRGGRGLSPLQVSASLTSGQVFDTDLNRATRQESLEAALTGWSVGGQVTLPTTQALSGAGGADPIVGVFPQPNSKLTAETGNGTGIPSVGLYKEYSIKAPTWALFPVRRFTKCQ